MTRYLTARCFAAALCLLIVAPAAFGQKNKDAELQKIDPPDEIKFTESPVLSPEEALKSFKVEEGFEVQLVASEPLINDPVCMAWDDQGRLWVCEMTGYMRNLKGEGEHDPIGNIAILTDTDGDGTMDERKDFLTGVVLPRAIAFVKGGMLYADTTTLYFVRINADGTAGATQKIDENYTNNGKAKEGNVEHQANGLLYGLDNWYYNAKSSRSYQYVRGRFRRSETEFRGQWGITQDDDGRLLANRNPVLIEYELLPPGATIRNPNFKFDQGKVLSSKGILRVSPSVYPVRSSATNRAYRPNQDVSHETWKLQRATAACGPVIYRGDHFPEAFYGNVFIPEPAGNLLKRVVLGKDENGRTTAEHAYADREFLASTDERSRFVNAYTGPDGALYVVDFYRGVIQHTFYLTDYFKRQIGYRKLDTPVGLGRIYRVVHKDTAIDTTPTKLADRSTLELVALLGHTNSWKRENAQRILAQGGDADAVEPLTVMATTDKNPQARIHALWTLQGMGKLTPDILALASSTTDPRVRVQVLRLSEQYEGKPAAKRFVGMMQLYNLEPSWEVDMQLALSAGILAGIDTAAAYDVLTSVLARHGDDPLFRHAAISGLRGKEAVMLARVKEDGKLKDQLFAALVKATENGDLTIGSLLELVDSPDFADKRVQMLGNLAGQAVEQDRHDVVDTLIEKMGAEGATPETQRAILEGMFSARDQRTDAIELDGKPAIFEQWSAAPPEALADLIERFEQVFIYERTKLTEDEAYRLALGAQQYETRCSTCHGQGGEGIATVAPPLIGSQWVNLHPKALTALVLNGVEGDIMVNGKLYTSPADSPGFMPGLKTLITDDEELSNILTYVRSKSFKNEGGEVTVETVAQIRQTTKAMNSMFSTAQIEGISDNAFRDDGVEPPPKPASVAQPDLVHTSWLDHGSRNLVITLLTVTVLMVLLLLATLFGGAVKV